MSTRLPIEGELTVFAVHAIKDRILAALAEGEDLEVDLADVCEVDGAGIQLLLAARREAGLRGVGFEVCTPSAVMADTLALCDLTDVLGSASKPGKAQA
ncbi:MAG: STAS domain-containing protein [Aquabacterium sp.]